MSTLWPIAVLVLIVGGIHAASRQRISEPLFRWLPVPLWCYVAPMLAVEIGLLPREHQAYQALTQKLLPFALAILLLGVDLPSILRTGYRALVATIIGSLSIVVGAPIVGWMLRHHLPLDAWKGVGSLSATWTGGSMNLLSVSSILKTPDSIFTSLIIVDAIITYGWMALLVSLSTVQANLDRWLHAVPIHTDAILSIKNGHVASFKKAVLISISCALGLSLAAHLLSGFLPLTSLVSSKNGWTVLLITTFALGASLLRPIRQLNQNASSLGYLFLYLVLAGMGAQASLKGILSAPAWIALGVGVALFHGLFMLLAGRLLRIPLGVLATASQANFGGVISTPLVGAVYDQSLAAVGLLLAVGCNAIGTYLGMVSAFIAHHLM